MTTLYETLGVSNTASEEDIKKAYRGLAKIHHPDAGGDSDKFNSVAEAYEILSDPVERRKYDNQLNGNNPFFDLFDSHPGMFYNFNVEQNYDSNSFINPVFQQNYASRQIRKLNPNIQMHIPVDMSLAYVGFSYIVKFDRHIECIDCMGTGKKLKNETCKKCQGGGRSQEIGSVQITVPPKIMSGHHLSIPNEGNVMADGKKGSLDIYIQYIAKSEGVICSIDGVLYKDIVVPWDMALLGEKFNFTVFSRCKNSIAVKLDSSLPNGGSQRLTGLGMGNGDLIIKVWYSLPTNLNINDRDTIAKAIRNANT